MRWLRQLSTLFEKEIAASSPASGDMWQRGRNRASAVDGERMGTEPAGKGVLTFVTLLVAYICVVFSFGRDREPERRSWGSLHTTQTRMERELE